MGENILNSIVKLQQRKRLCKIRRCIVRKEYMCISTCAHAILLRVRRYSNTDKTNCKTKFTNAGQSAPGGWQTSSVKSAWLSSVYPGSSVNKLQQQSERSFLQCLMRAIPISTNNVLRCRYGSASSACEPYCCTFVPLWYLVILILSRPGCGRTLSCHFTGCCDALPPTPVPHPHPHTTPKQPSTALWPCTSVNRKYGPSCAAHKC